MTRCATTGAFTQLIPSKNGFEVVPHIELDCNAGGPIVLVVDMTVDTGQTELTTCTSGSTGCIGLTIGCCSKGTPGPSGRGDCSLLPTELLA